MTSAPAQAPVAPVPDPAGRAARLGRAVALAVVVIFAGLAASNTLRDLVAIAGLPGEFSHGEAGKAFYAWRWKTGQGLFLSAAEPPHYPSFHGPALHVLVGSLAWVFDLSRDQMMGAGRAVALAGLAGLCATLAAIGRTIGLRWDWIAGSLMVFLACFAVHTASATYRPDTLMALCTTATCLVFLKARTQGWGRVLLVVLPLLGYLFKPLGISAAAATMVAFVMMREGRAAGVHAASTAGGLLLVVGGLQLWSGGLYLRSFSEGVRVEFGWAFLLAWMPPAAVLVPLVMAAGASVWQALAPDDATRRVAVVGCYLAMALAAALAGTLRAGAYFYYYLEAAALASVLAVWAAAQVDRLPTPVARLVAWGAVAVVAVVLWRADVQRTFTGPWIADQKIPAALEAERRQLLAFAREKRVRVFTNDPVLAVRLDDQAILYTSLMRQLIDAGTLDPEAYRRPLREGRWPVMALLNEGLPHNHAVTVDRLPEFDRSLADFEPVPWPGVMYRTYRFKPSDTRPSGS